MRQRVRRRKPDSPEVGGTSLVAPRNLSPVRAAVSCAVTAGTVGLLAAVFYAPSRRHRRPDSPGLGIWPLVACVLLLAGMALWLTVKDWQPLPGG